MTILGAIFAGGASRRYGSDKAAAMIGGTAMIDHVARQMRPQCDALVVVGRTWPGLETVPDRPAAGLGPLGALAGALWAAQRMGHGLVLTSGCDLPDLPGNLPAILSPAPAVVQGQPLLGLWHAADADRLHTWLEQGGDRAMRSWIAEIAARRVAFATPPSNINTPGDMAAFLMERQASGSDS